MTRLLYGYDPLCGWCYGFAPALRHIRQVMPDLVIHPVMGGLVTGDRIGPYAAMDGYIRAASARMTAVTGMTLSPAFFDRITGNPTVIASSVVPCAAVLQVRNAAPDRVVEFATAIQDAHFGQGADLNLPDVHVDVARSLGLGLSFDLPHPEQVPVDLAVEFLATRALGVSSYPTVILERNDHSRQHIPISYVPQAMATLIEAACLDQPDI